MPAVDANLGLSQNQTPSQVVDPSARSTLTVSQVTFVKLSAAWSNLTLATPLRAVQGPFAPSPSTVIQSVAANRDSFPNPTPSPAAVPNASSIPIANKDLFAEIPNAL